MWTPYVRAVKNDEKCGVETTLCFTLGGKGPGNCPECRRQLTKSDFFDANNRSEKYQAFVNVRERITKIYNRTRQRFDSTPGYNDYIEHREDLIQTLLEGSTEEKKRTEEEVGRYKKLYQSEILENEVIRNAAREARVREIVLTEGIRFEIAKLPWASNKAVALEALRHPLEEQYVQLFQNSYPTTDKPFEIKGLPRPIDSSIRQDSDFPRRIFCSHSEIAACDVAAGYDLDMVKQRQLLELVHGF